MRIIETYFKFRYFFVIRITVPSMMLIEAVTRIPSCIPKIGIIKNPAANVPKQKTPGMDIVAVRSLQEALHSAFD